VDPGAFTRGGAELMIFCARRIVMFWQVTPPMTGAANRSHSRLWLSACLLDQRASTGSAVLVPDRPARTQAGRLRLRRSHHADAPGPLWGS
jgi:hypothetical protein